MKNPMYGQVYWTVNLCKKRIVRPRIYRCTATDRRLIENGLARETEREACDLAQTLLEVLSV